MFVPTADILLYVLDILMWVAGCTGVTVVLVTHAFSIYLILKCIVTIVIPFITSCSLHSLYFFYMRTSCLSFCLINRYSNVTVLFVLSGN